MYNIDLNPKRDPPQQKKIAMCHLKSLFKIFVLFSNKINIKKREEEENENKYKINIY